MRFISQTVVVGALAMVNTVNQVIASDKPR
jgi:hypothetical protein